MNCEVNSWYIPTPLIKKQLLARVVDRKELRSTKRYENEAKIKTKSLHLKFWRKKYLLMKELRVFYCMHI